MSYQVVSVFHNAWRCRVLVNTSISATDEAACPFPEIVHHGQGLVSLYRNFRSLPQARKYQGYIKKKYVKAWSQFPACYVQSVLCLYNSSAVVPTVNGQLLLF